MQQRRHQELLIVGQVSPCQIEDLQAMDKNIAFRMPLRTLSHVLERREQHAIHLEAILGRRLQELGS